MDITLYQFLKRPLRAMHALGIFYIFLTILLSVLVIFSVVRGEPMYVLAFPILLTLTAAVVCRYAYNGLTEGRKSGWITATIMSSMCMASIFLPLGIYSLTGLFDKEVRNHCLD